MQKCILMTQCFAVTVMVLILSVGTPASANDYDDCFDKGSPDVTIRGCTNLLDSGATSAPELVVTYFNRGTAYIDKGEYDRAIADFDKVIVLDPDHAFAYNNRAVAYQIRGNIDRAIADYDKAIQIDPDYALALDNRRDAYRDKGKYDRAADDKKDCYDGNLDTEVNILACTRVLESGFLNDEELAEFHLQRSIKRCRASDFDGAADDAVSALVYGGGKNSIEGTEAAHMMESLLFEECYY